ncbi:MAG TPA: division/cell wall cluster transcriptional repressor MraZ [Arenibaculum sp.]|nr:division/cell wall cluster transcriptional repressor MraZ [Arenibaculum sp.]
MAVFLSTYVNRIDRKGRVSVPAPFRQVLAEQSATGIANGLVVFRSVTVPALEACSAKHMEDLAADLELMDLSDEEREHLELTIFSASVHLPIDSEGRLILPDDLRQFAGICEQVAFVGKSKTFQIWEPDAFNARMAEAREKSRVHGVSLSSISAAARRRATGT